MKHLLFLLCFFSTSLLSGSVENSILPLLNNTEMLSHSKEKMNEAQKCHLEKLLQNGLPLRVVSFNMLFNLPFSEKNLEPENRWPQRRERLIEYLLFSDADLIGSQELQPDQIEDLLEKMGSTYAMYGSSVAMKKQDMQAIFYRKDRLELIEGRTFTFGDFSPNLRKENGFSYCTFLDKDSQKTFTVINVHLAFGNKERRYREACVLKDILSSFPQECPLILLGDFNTFPFRPELDLPFYDGGQIISLLECGKVQDAMQISATGHFGPISSTNYCEEKKKSFCKEGTPGVILDHIFVNCAVKVLSHAIDPAQVDGYFPSDHLPVIAELVL